MHYSTIISTFFGSLILAVAVPPASNLLPRAPSEQATRVPYVGTLESIEHVSHCDDVVTSLIVGDATGKSTACYVNATAGLPEKRFVPNIKRALGGPYCLNDATVGPGLIDASTLCAYVPETFTLRPAYSATSCSCETWYVGTAVFAFCNCDPCSSISDSSLSNICFDIYDECFLIGDDYTRGYMTNSAPQGFFMLYGDGDQLGAAPVYSSC